MLFATLGTPPPGGNQAFLSNDLTGAVSPQKSGFTYALAAGLAGGAGPNDCNGTATNSAYYVTAVPTSPCLDWQPRVRERPGGRDLAERGGSRCGGAARALHGLGDGDAHPVVIRVRPQGEAGWISQPAFPLYGRPIMQDAKSLVGPTLRGLRALTRRMVMSSRTRYALVVLSALGLAASLAALYVHYRLITEPGYTSFCDVNETVSCEQVFESAYGTVAGVPVAAGGAIWSALVLMLSAWGMRTPKSDEAVARRRLRLPALHRWSRSRLLLRLRLVLRPASGVPAVPDDVRERDRDLPAVIGQAAGPLRTLQSGVTKDLGGLKGSPTAALLAVVWLVASAGLVLAFPREQAVSAQSASAPAAVPAVPVETLAPEQLD